MTEKRTAAILGMTTTQCQNADHDHSEPSGAQMQCSDCGILSHYDYTIEAYRHDDPTAPHCFLVRSSNGSECVR